MRYQLITILVLAAFTMQGESFRVFVDDTALKTTGGNISASFEGSGCFLPERAALQLTAGASLLLAGQPALLNGPYGTVELCFSPRNFRMDRGKDLHLELQPVQDCLVRSSLADDIWNFWVSYKGKNERHWLPVYAWYNAGRDPAGFRQMLTVSIGFKGINIYLNGLKARKEEEPDAHAVPESAIFRLASAAPFEFIALYVTNIIFSRDQVLDRYDSLQSKKKRIDRAFLRVPLSRKNMQRRGPPRKNDFAEAVALCGMNDIFTNELIQNDLQYYLQYDYQHLYIFSAAPVAANRRLGFFAMLKYTETFDKEQFTLNPWQPLAGAAAKTPWFTRTAVENGERLDEAWLEDFAKFGAEVPQPGVTWEVNFSNWTSPADRGVWYKSDENNIQSYGIIEFGRADDLFARMLLPPKFAGHELSVSAVCVNPGTRIRTLAFSSELFQHDGEIIAQKVWTGEVAPGDNVSNTLILDTGTQKSMLLKTILRDDEDRIFYRRTFMLNRN